MWSTNECRLIWILQIASQRAELLVKINYVLKYNAYLNFPHTYSIPIIPIKLFSLMDFTPSEILWSKINVMNDITSTMIAWRIVIVSVTLQPHDMNFSFHLVKWKTLFGSTNHHEISKTTSFSCRLCTPNACTIAWKLWPYTKFGIIMWLFWKFTW